MPYERCIFYAVLLAVVALDRPTLKSRVGGARQRAAVCGPGRRRCAWAGCGIARAFHRQQPTTLAPPRPTPPTAPAARSSTRPRCCP